ncbi:MAG: nitrite reductase (NAD(P)H) small subunit [Planctomycetota bacterium]|nr:MAG: nitrite reductase (NAD(P)H) small subunit [Planctomycetota bacterium]
MFEQFVNTPETEVGIEIVTERGQNRPADWPKDGVRLEDIKLPGGARLGAGLVASTNGNGHAAAEHREVAAEGHAETNGKSSHFGNGRRLKSRSIGRGQHSGPTWVSVGAETDFPKDGGATIKYGDVQIAVYNFTSRGEWYACQNMCPHKNAFVLSRGILGAQGETPKIACPLHKKTYSLASGACLSGEDLAVKVFPVRVVRGEVFLLLPRRQQLDALLATNLHCISACDAPKAREILDGDFRRRNVAMA